MLYGVTDELRVKRGLGLYKEDEAHSIRYSHENPYACFPPYKS